MLAGLIGETSEAEQGPIDDIGDISSLCQQVVTSQISAWSDTSPRCANHVRPGRKSKAAGAVTGVIAKSKKYASL